MKILCNKCKQYKDEHDFYKDKHTKTGFNYYCKECARNLNKKYHAIHADKNNKKRRELYRLNPEKSKKQTIEWYKKLRNTNPAKYRTKKFFEKKNEIENDVTPELIEKMFNTIKNCQCCGKKLSLNYVDKEIRITRSNPASPSIDRVNNDKKYSKKNIAVICWECNFRKTDLTLKDLEMFKLYIMRYGDV